MLKMLSLLAFGSEDALLAMDSSLVFAELAELLTLEGFDESEYHRCEKDCFVELNCRGKIGRRRE